MRTFISKPNALNNIQSVQKKKEKDVATELEREMASMLIFISERNNILISIEKELASLSKKIDPRGTSEIRKLQTLLKESIEKAEHWGEYKLHFEKVHPSFFKSMASLNNKITQTDLKIAAYIKIGLSVKEIAHMRGITPKSVEMAQYRLKKKLDLSPSQSLIQFILNI